MKFRVSEFFYSIQGEGLHVGAPSIFLRMFGCNFTCSGFGMPPGEKSQERFAINPVNFKTFEDLPLVKTGCDSYSSWDPRFKKFAKHYDVQELRYEIEALLPLKDQILYPGYRTWQGSSNQEVHLVITGGEPLLGWQKLYPSLLTEFQLNGLRNVTFETNGTQPLTQDFRDYMHSSGLVFTFSVSPKLSVSGEKFEDAIKPEVVKEYERWGDRTVLKFVVDQNTTVDEIKNAVDYYHFNDCFPHHVYLMPEGGTTDHYDPNRKAIVELCMRNGWRYSPRLHIDLFGNAWGT